ncbi:MAG: hypothetical protein LBG18_07820 [Mediterranea sp.]|jgi:hypothetical protein|nr:hypothetical protein [Mediterranea sp.]
MDTSNWIAFGSLIIAGIALLRAWKIDRELKFFELKWYREKEDEKKKALIEAKVYKNEDWWVINVYNRGLATAHNIRFISPEIADESKSGIIICLDNKQIPYPFLHNGGSFDIKAVLAEGHKPIVIAKFIWDDDFGNNNERELVLNF